jgi:TolB-like protein/tetratricopeptide (TPR) repeat protein
MSSNDTDISIAIFPFENLTKSGDADIFCRSFYVDLITEFARFRQFKIFPADSAERKDVHATYSIRGSYRFHQDMLRVNSQLINNERSQLAWADQYEFGKDSLVAVEEQVLKQIVGSIQDHLNNDLLAYVSKKPETSVSAYEYWLQGMEELRKGTVEADERARDQFKKAIDTTPQYSLAYSGMSLTYFNEWSCQLWERWDVSQQGAFEWAKKAIELDPHNHVAAMILGRVYLYEAEYDIAEHYLRKALQLNPTDTENLVQVASCFVFLGYIDEAEALYQKVLQYNAQRAEQFNYIGAFIAFERGDFETCIRLSNSTQLAWVDSHCILAAAYFEVGNIAGMEKSWQRYLHEFKTKIIKEEHFPTQHEAIQWVINVSPYRGHTNQRKFWEHMAGKETATASRNFLRTTSPVLNFFFRENDGWQISYENHSFRISDAKGINDIARLLSTPGEQIHCSELMGSMVKMRGEQVIDDKAKKNYKAKLLSLQEELSLAEVNNDYQRSALLQKEFDDILDMLSNSMGLNGRTRKSDDPIEKVRSAVTWRIRNSIKKISSIHPALGIHLSNSIKTGLFCSYRPEKNVSWALESE